MSVRRTGMSDLSDNFQLIKYMSELTTVVELDSKSCIGDLRHSLKEPASGAIKETKCVQLNMRRGNYLAWCSDKKDDTIFICHENVNVEFLRDELYKSDFGYTFSEANPKIWTSVNGNVWLRVWADVQIPNPAECKDADREITDGPAAAAASGDGDVLRSLCTSLGSKERASRSVLIAANEQLARLRTGNSGRVVLKKIRRAHGKTIYTVVEKTDDPKDIGYLIVWPTREHAKPPALHAVRDIDGRIFCILIGDNIQNRFSSMDKEFVLNTFSHYEGRIPKAKYDRKNPNIV